MVSRENPQGGSNSQQGQEPTRRDLHGPLSSVVFESFAKKVHAAQGEANVQNTKNARWSVYTFVSVAIYTALTAVILLVAKCTYDTDKENEYYTQRASVILSDIQSVSLNLEKTQIGRAIVPRWQNTGSTQANDFQYRINYSFSRDELPAGFSNQFSGLKVEGPATVGPKEVLDAGGLRSKDGQLGMFPESCMNDLTKGRFRYDYIWGAASYSDIFKSDKKRETRFCWHVYGTLSVKGELVFNHFLCDEGNCQDEACAKLDAANTPNLPIDTCQISVPISDVIPSLGSTQASPSPVSPPVQAPFGAPPATSR